MGRFGLKSRRSYVVAVVLDTRAAASPRSHHRSLARSRRAAMAERGIAIALVSLSTSYCAEPTISATTLLPGAPRPRSLNHTALQVLALRQGALPLWDETCNPALAAGRMQGSVVPPTRRQR